MLKPRDLVLEITRFLAATEPHRERARPRLQALVSAGKTDLLLEILNQRRLTPLLGSRAVALEPSLPTTFKAAVDQGIAMNRPRGLALEALALQVAERFGTAGISMLPLKGPFLARRLYGDVGMRLASDLDVLVSVDQLQEAAAVLTGFGYTSADPPWTKGLPSLHYVLRDPHGGLPPIELHWRIHWYEDEFSAALLERSSPGGAGLCEPQLNDELASLLLYYARDGFFGLRMAADIASWWELHGIATGGSPMLAQHWADYPRLRRALAAATLAAQATVGVPAASIVPRVSGADLRPRVAVRLACWSQEGERDHLLANIRVVDGLLSPPGGLWAFVRRFILLDPHEIAIKYESHSAAGTVMWRLWHVIKVAVRYTLSLGSALLPRRRHGPIAKST